MHNEEKARDFIAAQTHMVIAVNDGGEPWAVPVAIKRWDGMQFEWDSRLDTVHSRALEKDSRMAVVLFQKWAATEVGICAKGQGHLIEDKGDGLGRYRFIAEEAWMNDESFVKRKVDLA